MSVINATHPAGASKRAGKRAIVHGARGRGGGSLLGGFLILAVIAAMISAALLVVLSIPGHLLHLTPSITQVFGKHPPNYLHARYRNVVLGYALTAVGLIALVLTLMRVSSDSSGRPLWQFGLVVVVLLATALITATGERRHQLTVGQAAGVVLGPGQSRTLARVAQQAVLTSVEDSTGTDNWIVVPGECRFAKLTTNFLGTDYDFACTAQAFNANQHFTPIFRADVSCADPRPTASGCISDSDQDVTRLPGVRAVSGPVPAVVIDRFTATDYALLLRTCVGVVRTVTAQQLQMAVDVDRLYQQYGSTPFRLAPEGPVLSMAKLLAEAAAAGRGCEPQLTSILTAALPPRHA